MRNIIAVFTMYLVMVPSLGMANGPPYEDEDILGLEISGELLAPPSLVSQVGQDLAAILSSYPVFSDIHVYPDWPPGELIVGLSQDAWVEYLAGTFAELDSLNSEYGPVSIDPYPPGRLLVMEYEQLYHPEILAGIYEEIDGVSYAAPNLLGGDGNDIFSEQVSIYTFKRGWGDCESGCMYADYWVFSVSEGSVELIDHYGTSVSSIGSDQVGLATSIQGIAPNPFNPRTTIQYRLNKAGLAKMDVYDLRGRPVIELVNEFKYAGEYEVTWRGLDGLGTPVASGVYFCRLVVGGVAQVQRMTLLK